MLDRRRPTVADARHSDDARGTTTPLIRKGLAFLRAGSEYWYNINWTLRMFDVIISKLDMSLTGMGGMTSERNSANQFHWEFQGCSSRHTSRAEKTGHRAATPRAEQPDRLGSIEPGLAFNGLSDIDENPLFDSLMVGDDPEKWLDDLLVLGGRLCLEQYLRQAISEG